MKKRTAILLCLLMTAAFASCGTSENADLPDTSAEQNETITAIPEEAAPVAAPETEPETEPATESATESAAATPAETEPETTFDTGWAANEFEALLPELPLTGWKTEQKSDTEYKMELGGLKDQVITDENGNTVGYGEDKAKLIAYLEGLRDYGFTVEEVGGIEGYMYEWEIKDASGNEIEVTCAEGYCWITIHKK